MVEEDQGFVMQQSIGNMTTIENRDLAVALNLNIQHDSWFTYLVVTKISSRGTPLFLIAFPQPTWLPGLDR